MVQLINSSVQNIHQIINRENLTPYQWQIVFACFLMVLLDGLDIAIVAYIGPVLKQELSLSSDSLSYLFVSGVLGLMVGSMLFGPLADRYGRKKTLIISTILYSTTTVLCGSSPNLTALVIFRFLTGLGLGGAMPISLSLCAEYMPQKHKMLLSTLAWCGFTLGIALGGVVATFLLPILNWRWLFYLAGITPLLALVIIISTLPESFEYLLRSKKTTALIKVQHTLNRLYGSKYTLQKHETIGETITKEPIKQLFSSQYRYLTLALWLSFFGSLLLFYLLTYWIPIVLENFYTFDQVNLITMMLPIGGTIGAIILAHYIDNHGKPFLTLGLAYLFASILLFFIGSTSTIYLALLTTVFMIGFSIAGAQNGLNLVAATVYDNRIRATGVSWAMAIGRLGSICGAYIGVWFTDDQQPMLLFSHLSFIALFCAVGLLSIHSARKGVWIK